MRPRMTLEINRLHPSFFAEVSGVNLTKDFDDKILQEIIAAFSENAVLLFRDQGFDDTSQIKND